MFLQRNSGDPTQSLRSYPEARIDPCFGPDTACSIMASQLYRELLGRATARGGLSPGRHAFMLCLGSQPKSAAVARSAQRISWYRDRGS